jgi:hypothetical protein
VCSREFDEFVKHVLPLEVALRRQQDSYERLHSAPARASEWQPYSDASMSHNRQSLLVLPLDSPSSDDNEDLLIGTSQIMYTHYQTMNTSKHGGSVPEHRVVCRKREACHWKLFKDYFSHDPTYDAEYFRWRFLCSHFITFFVSNPHDYVDHVFKRP